MIYATIVTYVYGGSLAPLCESLFWPNRMPLRKSFHIYREPILRLPV